MGQDEPKEEKKRERKRGVCRSGRFHQGIATLAATMYKGPIFELEDLTAVRQCVLHITAK